MISLLATALLLNENSALTGYASNYGDGNPYGNACGYKGTSDKFDNWAYAAIGSGAGFDDGLGCGQCFKVRCTGAYGYNPTCSCDTSKELIIQSLDQCPECTAAENHAFDLTATAMDYFTGSRSMTGTCGLISVEYEAVECGVSGNLKIRTKSGTSRYWYGVHLDNIGGYGSVSKIEIKSQGSSSYATTCDKSQGPSFWICNGGYPLSFPLSVRLTSTGGDKITCSKCIGSADADYSWDFGSNFGSGGSAPYSSPTPKPTTKTPTQGSSPVSQPTTPPVSSSGGVSIRIKQNQGNQVWWVAFEFPDGDINKVQKIWFKDSSHSSWIQGTKTDWGAYEFSHGGVKFSGKQSIKIKVQGKTFVGNNIFTGPGENIENVVTLSSGSSFTEEETDESGLSTAGLAAIIIVALLAMVCIIGGVYYYKKHWNKNKGEASFKTTGADTPQSKGTSNDKEAEIEVEMNVEYTNETR